MDHMKEALKQKMGKHLKIEIHVKPGEKDPDSQESMSKTDMAPVVKDSQEAGVVKSVDTASAHSVAPEASHMDSLMMPAVTQHEEMHPVLKALLAQSPNHPKSGKTLDSTAKEQMLAKIKNKKKGV